MSYADSVTENRGGARAGAGRKPSGYDKPEEGVQYDKAKARKEASLADMHELNFKIKLGQYVERAAYREASATLVANMAQTLRSLADNLERKFSLDPKIAVAIEAEIDAALNDVASGLQKLTEAPVNAE